MSDNRHTDTLTEALTSAIRCCGADKATAEAAAQAIRADPRLTQGTAARYAGDIGEGEKHRLLHGVYVQ